MPLDPTIALGIQAPQIASPLDSMAKAYTLKRLANETQMQDQQIADDQATRQAFANNVTTNPDGTTTLNRQAALSDLYKVNPAKAIDYQKLFQNQDIDQLSSQMKASKDIAWSVNDEQSYQAARQKMQQLNLPNASQMPEHYMPSFVQSWQMHSLEGDKQAQIALEQQKMQQQSQDRAENRALRGAQMQQYADARQDKADQKQQDKVDKLVTAMKNDFDADKGRSGNFGMLSGKVQSADRLQTLIDAYKGGDLPKAQMEELALGMSNMLANSSGASRSQVEALVPHTLWGGTQDAASYLLNEPRGAGQQKFVEKMADTIQREKAMANDQLNSIRAQRLPAHDTLKQLAPDRYNALLQSYGLDPSNIKDGKYVSPVRGSAGGPKDDSGFGSDVVDYAQKHGITNEQAQAIKDQRTAQ